MFAGRESKSPRLVFHDQVSILTLSVSLHAASEHLSDKEIRDGEAKAAVEVQIFTVACVALWFCMSAPVSQKHNLKDCGDIFADTCLFSAPHVVEWARKLF